MKRGLWLAAVLPIAWSVSGCGEEPQTTDARRKVNAQAYSGAVPAYTAGNWKAGDATAWEQQIRYRTQYQNEYGRLPP